MRASTADASASWPLEEEREYRLLFENNPNPMWVHDEETLAFLAVNEAAVQLYGYSAEQFRSMTLRDIRPAADVPILLQALDRQRGLALAPGGIWRHQKRDGTLIDVDITASAVNFQGRPARLVLARDITERREREETFREAREQ